MTTEDQDSDEPEKGNENKGGESITVKDDGRAGVHRRRDPPDIVDTRADALAGVRKAYRKAIAARAAAVSDDERDKYVALTTVLLAVGRALDRDDAPALGVIASAAKAALESLPDPPMHPKIARLIDPDTAGGSLVEKKDFRKRAEARVRELLSKPQPPDAVAEHFARLVTSGPWRKLCRSAEGHVYISEVVDDKPVYIAVGQKRDAERVASGLNGFGTPLSLDHEYGPKDLLRATLVALGATTAEARQATRSR